MFHHKSYKIILFLTKYFSIFFMVIIILEYLSIFPLVYLNGIVRYSVTGVIFLGLLIMINSFLCFKKSSGNKTQLLLGSIVDLTFVVRMITLFKEKERDELNKSDADNTFLFGVFIFLLFFIIYSLFSLIIFHYPHLLNEILKTNKNLSINVHLKNIPSLIIIRNMIFLTEMYIGSFLFLIPTIGIIISDSLITTPILVHLIEMGNINIILPQLLLEMLGTSIASGTSFLIFYTLLNSLFDKDRKLNYFNEKFYSLKLIISGFILSIYAFLVAFTIESSLLEKHSLIWYHFTYLFDIVTIIIYIAFFYNAIYKKIFQFDELVFSSLANGIVLFVLIAQNSGIRNMEILYLGILLLISLLYPIIIIMNDLRSFYIENFKLKQLYKYLKYNNLTIYNALGRSMYPEINSNDYLIVKPIKNYYDYKIGDIILYEPSFIYNAIPKARFVCHRIIGFKNGKIITKGDNNKIADPSVKPYQIYGVVIEKYDQDSHSFEVFDDKYINSINNNDINNLFKNNFVKSKNSFIYTRLIPLLLSFVIILLFLL